MNLRSLLVLLATIIWFLIGGVLNWVCSDCEGTTQSAGSTSNIISQGAMGVIPLSFNWSQSTPGSEARLAEFLNTHLTQYNGDDSLIITGPYFPEEDIPEGFANMGLARAQSIKDLLIRNAESGEVTIPNFDPNKVILRARRFSSSPTAQQGAFEGADLTVVPPSVALAPIAFTWEDARASTDGRLAAYFNRLLEGYNGKRFPDSYRVLLCRRKCPIRILKYGRSTAHST